MTFTFEEEEDLVQAYHRAVILRREAEKTMDYQKYIQVAEELEKIGLDLAGKRVRDRAKHYQRVGSHG